MVTCGGGGLTARGGGKSCDSMKSMSSILVADYEKMLEYEPVRVIILIEKKLIDCSLSFFFLM